MRAGASKLVALLATVVLIYGLAPPAPAGADSNLCQPTGKEGAIALPRKLATANRPREDKYTTADVEPLSSVNIDALGLRTPRTLVVGTQPGGPPTSCLDPAGRYTGYDNELLRAIAAKLGLQVVFAGTEFSGLLAQVASRRFDVGSSSIMATEARRRTVGFTNGYDFGYLSLIVPSGSALAGFDDLARGQRIGVVQGTVEEAYVVDTLHIEPVKFPDFTTVYTSVKTHQIDAWVAPAMEATNVMRPGDTASVAAYTFGVGDFVAYAVSKDNQPLIAALNAGLDAVIADGTWSQLYTDWVPRPLPRALAALAGAFLLRHLPRSARGGDHPADRARDRPTGGRCDQQQPVSAGYCGAGADRGGVYRRDLPLRHPERRAGATGRRPRVGAELSRLDADDRDPAGHPTGASCAGQPVHRAAEGVRAGVFPGADRRPARAVPGRPRPQRADRQPLAASRRGRLLPAVDHPADPPGQRGRPPPSARQNPHRAR